MVADEAQRARAIRLTAAASAETGWWRTADEQRDTTMRVAKEEQAMDADERKKLLTIKRAELRRHHEGLAKARRIKRRYQSLVADTTEAILRLEQQGEAEAGS